jgi:predicted pyridoxine 5'-phosphate oxidase superfamily flavin-nucleotide-binding protein
MARIPKEALDVLASPNTLKMLGTVNKAGIPNAAIIGTAGAVDEETIAFGELAIKKTKENLLDNKKFTLTVLAPTGEGYQMKGTFLEFQERGPIADALNEKVFAMIRKEIRSAGIGKVEEVYSVSLKNPGAKLA